MLSHCDNDAIFMYYSKYMFGFRPHNYSVEMANERVFRDLKP